MSTVSAIPLVDALLSNLLVPNCGGLVSRRVVDSGVELSTDGFAGAVDHANALTDRFSESASHNV
jgi:hypothetical protein